MDANTLTSLPAEVYCIIAVVVIIFFAIVFRAIFPALPPSPRAFHSWDQPKVDADHLFRLREGMINAFKALGGARFDARANGSFNIMGPIAFILVIFVLGGSIYALADSFSLIDHAAKNKVQEGEVCTGIRNGQLVYLSVDSDKQHDDICNGEPVTIIVEASPTTVVEPSPSPSPISPATQMAYPSSAPAPTVTPAPTMVHVKVIILDGNIVNHGWMPVPDTGGYTMTGEVECTITGDNTLLVPQGASSAFILFEGGRDDWMISNDPINIGDTMIEISNGVIKLNYCKYGTWYSVWAK